MSEKVLTITTIHSEDKPLNCNEDCRDCIMSKQDCFTVREQLEQLKRSNKLLDNLLDQYQYEPMKSLGEVRAERKLYKSIIDEILNLDTQACSDDAKIIQNFIRKELDSQSS